jgi:hypothetical protein
MDLLIDILRIVGIFVLFGATWAFLQTNLYLTLYRWFWSAVLFIAGMYTFWRTIASIDFDAPVLLSFRWSTVGFLFLSVLLLFLAWAVFRVKMRYDE